jgi:hypothetical protein
VGAITESRIDDYVGGSDTDFFERDQSLVIHEKCFVQFDHPGFDQSGAQIVKRFSVYGVAHF